MELGLRGKVSLVTASSKGIGLGVSKVLAAEGCKVAISSRNKEELGKSAKQITEATGNKDILPISCDLAVREQVDRLVDEIESTLGSVDVLAYNTGPPRAGTFEELEVKDWEYATNLLLLNAVWLTKRIVPRMVSKKFGRLIFITSLTLKHPMSNLVLSNTVRMSIAGLSKSLAAEYAGRGVTSNCILPGHILTDRVVQLAEDRSRRTGLDVKELLSNQLKDVPAGRFGKPEEIGSLVAFLASDKADYINGTMINIDGGLIKSVF